jgi:hypothetical protein
MFGYLESLPQRGQQFELDIVKNAWHTYKRDVIGPISRCASIQTVGSV